MGLIFLFVVLLLIFISMTVIGIAIDGVDHPLATGGICGGVLALGAVIICSLPNSPASTWVTDNLSAFGWRSIFSILPTIILSKS